MKIILDTSALVRLLTNDDSQKAAKVESLLKNEKSVLIPDVVFPELEYVLTSAYKMERSKLIDIYYSLLSQKNVKTSAIIKKAVELFANSQLDMADSIIASSSIGGTLASFDHDMLRVPEINPFWK